MLIETTQRILGYEGEELSNGTKNGEPNPLTFRDAVGVALNNFGAGENPGAEQKATAFELCAQLYASPAIEITVEQAAFIKQRCGAISTPLVYGRVCEIIENAAQIDTTEPVT